MPEQPNPITRQIGQIPMSDVRPSGYPGYHKGRAPGSSRRGRLYVLLIFCALRIPDACAYFGSPQGAKRAMIAAIITGALWTTSLLIGVWFRHDWCRPSLAVVLIGSMLATLYVLHSAFDSGINPASAALFSVIAAVDIAAAWAIVGLRDIRHLTSRAHTSRPYGYK